MTFDLVLIHNRNTCLLIITLDREPDLWSDRPLSWSMPFDWSWPITHFLLYLAHDPYTWCTIDTLYVINERYIGLYIAAMGEKSIWYRRAYNGIWGVGSCNGSKVWVRGQCRRKTGSILYSSRSNARAAVCCQSRCQRSGINAGLMLKFNGQGWRPRSGEGCDRITSSVIPKQKLIAWQHRVAVFNLFSIQSKYTKYKVRHAIIIISYCVNVLQVRQVPWSTVEQQQCYLLCYVSCAIK